MHTPDDSKHLSCGIKYQNIYEISCGNQVKNAKEYLKYIPILLKIQQLHSELNEQIRFTNREKEILTFW